MPLRRVPLADLEVDDERSFRHVGLYDELKRALLRANYRFRVPEGGRTLSWDRAVFLNLTTWSASDEGDVLVTDRLPADVVMHVAWHKLAHDALGEAARTAEGLFLGESIASGFDIYLVGRLLGNAPDAPFLETQVPAMADVAQANGLDEEGFEMLLESAAKEPERAFEEVRELLYDAATALYGARTAEEASEILEGLEGRRFSPVLHHFELSNWVLYARAHAAPGGAARAIALDAGLRSAADPVAFLRDELLGPGVEDGGR